jgi:peptidoglycan/xylan/chitin deacetylase (PgdA/CDA1 family)
MPSPSPASQVAASATSGEERIAGPGILDVPILLYHHVDPGKSPGKFNVTPAQFELQVQSLAAGGFQSITPANLRQAVLDGAPLPPRPIIITIDDGHENAYVHAYPILEEYGFDAVVYVVANRLWSTGCLSAEQLIELSEAGWEVGSHSLTHADLTTRAEREMRLEIFGSREQLEANLGREVTSFAYPFGAFSPEVADQVWAAGYQTAMGLGTSTLQGRGNLFYLSRIPVNGSWTASEFAAGVGFDGQP